MSSINQLTSQTSLSASDLVAIWSSGNSDTRRVSLYALAAFLQDILTAGGGMITQYAAPNVSGYSVTIAPPTNGATMWLLLIPNAAYAALTVTMPAVVVHGQEVLITSTQAVTTLTLNGNGRGVVGAPTTLAANAFFRLRFDGVLSNWYRVA